MIVKVLNIKPDSNSEKLTFFKSIFSGKYQCYLQQKRRDKIRYWWVEVENNAYKRYIAFDEENKPIKNTEKPKLDSFNLKSEVIYFEIFEDIYNLMYIQDMYKLEEVHSKYLKSWSHKVFITPPVFPVYSIDYNDVNDTIEKYLEPSDMIMNSDLIGYEWAESERIIDSLGQLYEVQYLNFGHPMGVVIPKRIERVVSIDELNQVRRSKVKI